MQSGFIFTTSPWFTLLCVVVGVAYAWLLYSPKSPWSKTANWGLAAVRAVLVGLLCFLLMGPRVRSVENSIEKAKVVLAVDNSRSMQSSVSPEVRSAIRDVKDNLEKGGYTVSIAALDANTDEAQEIDSLRFDYGTSDLAGFLSRIRSDFEGENLSDVILLSDGIVNQGSSPAFGNYPFKVHTVAVGDTIPSRDLKISAVRANQVAFLGNLFPIQVDVSAFGVEGQQATLTLTQGKKVLASKPVRISGENFFETAEFMVASSEKGMQRFTLEISAVAGEKELGNNRREVFIDIIDGRENILLLALSPHPDLKAFRSIVSQNENYELDIHILSLGSIPEEIARKKYDLLILHQIPDIYNLSNSPQVTALVQKDTPIWTIYGNQTLVAPFNRINRNLTITTQAGQNDQVSGTYNKSFNTIAFDSEKFRILDKLPPISVPFGNYSVNPGTEIILSQRVGNLETKNPLLTINTTGETKKSAVFLGDGLWLWRQEEFLQTGKTEVIDEMVLKVIQLLALKEDKRKLRVTPVAREFSTREPVVLQTEVYNDLYEKIYGQEITLKITDEDGNNTSYTYVNTEGQPHFRISGLKEGAYRFTASTVLKGKTETIEGRFLVRDIDLEGLSLTADYGMLRELALKTGGRFLQPEQLEQLSNQMVSEKSPDRINSREEVLEIIYLKWLFFFLVCLASIEWATRKYLGGY